jgi:putative ubiquitin-RnfH superfamily antitoxin RatB of RatAB toxin-antitoxin module
MHRVERSVLVPYSDAEMFGLVADIKSYPRFLPWCAGTRVRPKEADAVEATVEIAYRGVRSQFTTLNEHEAPREIRMRLVDGPFRRLGGEWTFTAAARERLQGAPAPALPVRQRHGGAHGGAGVRGHRQLDGRCVLKAGGGGLWPALTRVSAEVDGLSAGVAVTVVYGAPDRLVELAVTVPHGATLLDAVIASGLLVQVPALSAPHLDLGVFNRPQPPDTPVRPGDRIEVYRPLVVDPKEARRLRVALRKRSARRLIRRAACRVPNQSQVAWITSRARAVSAARCASSRISRLPCASVRAMRMPSSSCRR